MVRSQIQMGGQVPAIEEIVPLPAKPSAELTAAMVGMLVLQFLQFGAIAYLLLKSGLLTQ